MIDQSLFCAVLRKIVWLAVKAAIGLSVIIAATAIGKVVRVELHLKGVAVGVLAGAGTSGNRFQIIPLRQYT